MSLYPISPDEQIADGPPPEALAAYVAEINARVKIPRDPRIGLIYNIRCPREWADLMARNAACVVHELRSRGKTRAEVRDDVDAFAGPFLRGLLGWSRANGDEGPWIDRDIKNVVTSLLDAIVDLADPAWEPGS